MEYTGQIVKGVGSFYTVRANGADHVCKARGRFRNDGLTPVPGDMAVFDVGSDGKGYLLELLPRKNLLLRPMVANLDKLMIVISASYPRPDYVLADKLLLQCETLGVIPVMILNKSDEKDDEIYRATLAQYAPAGYRIIVASAETGEGIEEIKKEISGCVCCFAGQSAVGKSSLMNAIAPGLGLEVGGLSEKTERGKHTTRHAQLWNVCGGAMLDTPGFSLLDMADIEPQKLGLLYPEMRRVLGRCRFAECLHITEPDCALKPLVGEIMAPERYDRYVKLIEELKEKRKHKYD